MSKQEAIDKHLRTLVRVCIEECVEYLCEEVKKSGRGGEFTTADIERIFAERYPGIWAQAMLRYGKEGRYTIRNYIGSVLNNMAQGGLIRQVREDPAPADWGSPRIVVWRCV